MTKAEIIILSVIAIGFFLMAISVSLAILDTTEIGIAIAERLEKRRSNE